MNSKRKGNKYEITISRILSRWYSKNDSEDYFWRTAGSGAKSTVTKRGESSFVGDIVFLPNPDAFELWIDVKDRKNATFNNLLLGNNVLLKWYNEEKEKARKLNMLDKKIVVIIFKLHNKKGNYIFFNADDIGMVSNDFENIESAILLSIGFECYGIMDLNTFLDVYQFTDFLIRGEKK